MTTPPPPTIALLAFTPTAEAGPPTPLYPGLPPPPPPPRCLAALARVGGGRGGGPGAAATPAGLWAARAARASPAPLLVVTRAGGDEEAVRQWVRLAGEARPPTLVVAGLVEGVDREGGGAGSSGSLVGGAARAAAARAPPGAPVLLIGAGSVPMPWVDLARLVAAGRVLGCPAVPVSTARPPAALAAGGALCGGGGWWEGMDAGAAAGAAACPALGEASSAASPSARPSLPILYLPAGTVAAFAAAADGVGAESLGAALAAFQKKKKSAAAVAATPLAGLPLPAPLPTAATRAGRALAAALLAKPPSHLADRATIADALDGAHPAAAAFADALMASAGVAEVPGTHATHAPPPPPATTPPPAKARYAPPPRTTHPAYTTTNADYGARPPAPHEVALPGPAIAARAAARAAMPPLNPPALGAGKERGMRLAGAGQWLAN